MVVGAEWLREVAGEHTTMGSKLINIARRMKTKARQNGSSDKTNGSNMLNKETIDAYSELATKFSNNMELTDQQKQQVQQSWNKAGPRRTMQTKGQTTADGCLKSHIAEIQQHARNINEMHQEMQKCDVNNTTHAAKITRMGELHIRKAKAVMGKLRGEITNVKRMNNACKRDGIGHLSKAIGYKQAKPLFGVLRDRDTVDGGTEGQIANNPRDIDAIVKRAWKAIHDGMAGFMQRATWRPIPDTP